MTWLRGLLGVIAAVTTLGLGAPAAASQAPEAVSCGEVLTADTILGNDLADCPGNGLVVGASGITIDLNGHTLDGNEPTNYLGGYGILVPGAFDQVTITGKGRIRGFAFGVWLNGTSHTTVQGITVENNLLGVNLSYGRGNVIRHVRTQQNTGIRIAHSDETLIQANHIVGGAWGILIGDDADDNMVLNNVVTGDATSYWAGIQVTSVGSERTLIRGNRVARTGRWGIALTEGTKDNNLDSNRVQGASQHGIYVDGTVTGSRVAKNRVASNAVDGIDVAAGAMGTVLEKNRAWGNGNWGIAAFSPVLAKGNRAWGNGQPTQCAGLSCR